MAADGDGFSFSIEDVDTAAVIKLQAVCRRWLVNKHLQETREEYEEIVRELDGTCVIVDWTTSRICQPIVRRMPKGSCRPKLAAGFGGDRNVKVKTKIQVQACEYGANTRFPEKSKGTDVKEQTAVQKSNQEVQTDLPQMVNAPALCFTTPVTGFAPIALTTLAGATDSKGQELDLNEFRLQQDQRHKQDGCKQIADSRRHELTQVETPLTSRVTTSFAGKKEAFILKDSGRCEKIGTTPIPCTRIVQCPQGSHLTPAATDLCSVTCRTMGQEKALGSLCSMGDHGDQTSVWDCSCSDWPVSGSKEFKSGRVCEPAHHLKIPQVFNSGAQLSDGKKSEVSKEELLQTRRNVAMELLWVQQAIISRKNYLRLKSQMK